MRLLQLVLSTVAVAGSLVAQTYTISTFAGGGLPINIPGTSASLDAVYGVAVDRNGNVFMTVVNYDVVLRWDVASGLLTLIAGSGTPGFSGDNGPAASAQLDLPFGIAVDSAGSVYFADLHNSRIRRVSNGVITTVAGGGSSLGDNGPATSAGLKIFNGGGGIAVDSSGNLYIADTSNCRIRKVSNGIIVTVAGNGTCGFGGDTGPAINAQLNQPSGIAVDAAGNLYIADAMNLRIRKVSNGVITTIAGNGTTGVNGDNGPATSAQLALILAVAVDSSGNVYIGDGDRVRKVAAGIITTVAGNVTFGFLGDNGPAINAQLWSALGVAVDSAGNLFVADSQNHRVRRVSNGVITTVVGGGYSVGDNGPASAAQLSWINNMGVAVDSAGNVYVTDVLNNRVRRISNGVITTVVGGGTSGLGDDGPATNAQLSLPEGVAVDAAGNLYVADTTNYRIRKVSNGVITTVAGNGNRGYSGDNGPATNAELGGVYSIAVDSNGDLYLADDSNLRVRKVSNGVITTVAGNGTQGSSGDNGPATGAQLGGYLHVALDGAGSLYIADNFNYRIRKVSNGIITTVAGNGTQGFSGDGGPATSAQLTSIFGYIAVDSVGGLYIADSFNNRIRKVSNGIITTVAGNGTQGFSGDNGPAISAQLNTPIGIAVDSLGKVYVADSANNRIRLLSPPGSSCTYSVSPTSLQASASGGNLIVSIQTTASCSWTVTGLPNWITLSGVATGAGPANITLVVSPNSGAALSATILVAGISVSITQPTQSSAVAITTLSPLLPAGTGLPYSQTLVASGGSSPYTWSITSGTPPSGLTVSSSGVITGTPTTAGTYTFTVQVTDAGKATASKSFTLTTLTVGTPVRSGSLAHIAAGGAQWSTIITLVNTSASPVAVSVVFHQDDGSIPATMPVTTTQQGITQTVTGGSVNTVLGSNSSLLISAGDPSQSQVIGWADVLSSGPVGGFAIFRSALGTPSEGTVPLQIQAPSAILLPYDNTAGFTMGVALANLSASSATITATIWDDSGTLLGSQGITVAGSGHTSFVLPTQLPLTSGKRGIVRFQSSGTGGLTGLGLRFSPFGTFTSVPTILP